MGLIFAKLARAKKRNTTLLFSRNAVICLRDGEFCLLFRVGDIRKSHILEAHVRAQIIMKKVLCSKVLNRSCTSSSMLCRVVAFAVVLYYFLLTLKRFLKIVCVLLLFS